MNPPKIKLKKVSSHSAGGSSSIRVGGPSGMGGMSGNNNKSNMHHHQMSSMNKMFSSSMHGVGIPLSSSKINFLPTDSEEMKELKEHQLRLETQLSIIEKDLYKMEEIYIDENPTNNIIAGWDIGFLDSKVTISNNKRKVNDKDRIFSYSSISFHHKMLENPDRFKIIQHPSASSQPPLLTKKRSNINLGGQGGTTPKKSKKKKNKDLNKDKIMF